ncbi:MAG TPA: hypothetical protein PKJ91_06075, partial [Methanoregulaceae archaeon]|nr:hypothetical protein [Methanoregulaceae archaeon]
AEGVLVHAGIPGARIVVVTGLRLVLAARAAGGYGAKLTGAGGGGCVIAICPKHLKSRIVGAIESCEARAFSTSIDTEGVRKEKDA